jgi:CHASE2 domain-containing sensor protein
MHVLIADGILIVVMIMIGLMTEAMGEKANKEMSTMPNIKDEKIGIVEIKEEAIHKTGDTPMTTITEP